MHKSACCVIPFIGNVCGGRCMWTESRLGLWQGAAGGGRGRQGGAVREATATGFTVVLSFEVKTF